MVERPNLVGGWDLGSLWKTSDGQQRNRVAPGTLLDPSGATR